MKLSGHCIVDLLKTIRHAQGRVNCTGLSGAEQAYLLYRLYADLNHPLLVLCAKTREAELLAADVRFFSGGTDIPIITFPSYDILPFKPVAYHPRTACQRIETLYRILTDSQPPIVITTVSALLQKVIPRQVLSRFAEYIVAGEEIDREGLVRKLIQGGYQEAVLVEDPGDFAIRGGLIDVFSPLYPDPIRIEFFGDTVESVRTFSAADQRSLRPISEVTLLPAAETALDPSEMDHIAKRVRGHGEALEMPGLRAEEIIERLANLDQFPGIGGLVSLIHASLDTLFDYCPKQTLPVVVDPGTVEKLALDAEEAVTRSYLSAFNDGRFCVEPEALYLTWSEVDATLAHRPHVVFTMMPVVDAANATFNLTIEKNELITQQLRARPGSVRIADTGRVRGGLAASNGAGTGETEDLLRPLIEWINRALTIGLASYMVCHTRKQAERLLELLMPYGVRADLLEAFPGYDYRNDSPCICLGELSSGFVWPNEALAIITENEIFGHSRKRARFPKQEVRTPTIAFEDLKTGDLVVHTEHGIGRYNGLVKLEVADIANDFMLVEYRDGDRLYVPVYRMNCVQKYVGVDGIAARLDKMGGRTWQRVKERVKKSIRKMAGELLKLYAWRRVQEGHAFSPPDRYFEDFEVAFEYAETPDQTRAIADVMADMESPVPMDRLVCGDVGYGKTEIALRAAFKAVWDHKQVAFLVPTTVLAEQHFQTFKNRFEPYPVEIEALSRFRSPGQQRAIVRKMKAGKVDIVIGTHRLLQKDIVFKDLGLVIIDEEQRFGVAHKERLKQLRRCVDVLALTATPIPRTLHMSLMGARDLSIMATPPEYRYAIKTYICPFDDTVVAEAFHRELQRNGQIFFVHNNIHTIWAVARHLAKLVPGVRIGVAHGRLDDEELEKVMLQLLHREIDVLVCTSIIESGLDFPSANTILINRADKFGLAQIYQLRGRVGRAEEQAYAYLFIPHESALTRDARKRLKVLMEHSDLGAGFQIAMSDLQIRGGGTILGPSQSGQIASVGYEMYLELMERTTNELKGEPVVPEVEPEIKVNQSAYIPETYVSDIDQRLVSYKRLAKMTEPSEVVEFHEELRDRFGPVPEPARVLMDKIVLKVVCKKMGIQRLDLTDQRLVLSFSQDCPLSPEKITRLIERDPGRFRLTADGVLQVSMPSGESQDPLKTTKKVLQDLG
ncbi:MAG: transcription-repair coupling factor [Desulfobacterales bacterium]|nr:transcription-repair coupling factor [Desulfobacterales bacterium]